MLQPDVYAIDPTALASRRICWSASTSSRLPPASYRLSAKPVLPPRCVEGAANGAAAAAEDLPIEAPLRRKLEAFLAPFNRELAARTGIQF